MARSPWIIKDATDTVAATAGVSTGVAAFMDIVSVALALVVGAMSVVALFYSIKLRRREWRRSRSKGS